MLLLNRYQQYLSFTLCDLSLTTPPCQKNRACMYECLRLRERVRKRARRRERKSGKDQKRQIAKKGGKEGRQRERERERQCVYGHKSSNSIAHVHV